MKEQQTLDANERIMNDAVLGELDVQCKELPVFPDYVLVSKGAGRNSKYVSHYYSSPSQAKVDYPSLRNFYLDYFNKSGWKIIEDRDFGSKWLKAEKSGNQIQIYTAPDWGMEYGKLFSISCEKAG